MASTLRNTARTKNCRSEGCSPSDEVKAILSSKMGRGGKSKDKGFNDLMTLIGAMKESNIWEGSIQGYFFKGNIPTSMKSSIMSFALNSGWKMTSGKRIVKYGKIYTGGTKRSRKHLLIFGYYKGGRGMAYCSLTII
jgi:hypothetical protein